MGEAVVETTLGRLAGAVGEVLSFKGAPYAGPPLGSRRFQPPQPHPGWPGVRDAKAYGARAMQIDSVIPPDSPFAALAAGEREPMSEDCLFLNVWTPALDRAARPVMVWLHGGAFVTGSGGSPTFDGTRLAADQDVVVVTLNHRLGPFGYLYLAERAEGFEASGNAGMLDIIQALEWVRDNIAAFGGDPGNVTIFGESGGGAKVSVLLGMPAAQGLFHKAIMQSGPAVEMMAPPDADTLAGKVLSELGLEETDLAGLLTADAEELTKAGARASGPMNLKDRRTTGFNPVVDGRCLPNGPFEPVAPRMSAGVPLLIGTNAHETTLFFVGQTWFETMDDDSLMAPAAVFAGERAEEIVAAYRAARPGQSAKDIFVALSSDVGMRLPSLITADRKAALGEAPVYVYHFTWESPIAGGRLRSTHALEIPFVFDTCEAAAAFTGDHPARDGLAKLMSATWARFARTGDPNHEGLPHWPAHDPATRPTMVFGVETALAYDPGGAERRAWD